MPEVLPGCEWEWRWHVKVFGWEGSSSLVLATRSPVLIQSASKPFNTCIGSTEDARLHWKTATATGWKAKLHPCTENQNRSLHGLVL